MTDKQEPKNWNECTHICYRMRHCEKETHNDSHVNNKTFIRNYLNDAEFVRTCRNVCVVLFSELHSKEKNIKK